MNTHNYSKVKERKKFVRTILQLFVMLVLIYILLVALISSDEYEPSMGKNEVNDGFIAISYFGVEHSASETLISTDRLDEHLRALKESGYVTISQQDVLKYYLENKKLPEKALFLMFEDGRRDTALFAQKILEKYNFKATMLTYADKFEKKDSKFLSIKDLIEMDKDTFWELGTNGYRLEYINVFDRYDNYVGELNTNEFVELAEYFDRDYDHYLMDFIRDSNGIPKESYEELKERIESDYEKVEEIYSHELGFVPKLYALMHSNTGKFGTGDKASKLNENSINRVFDINFNREGYALNKNSESIYNLTRVQPQAYWSVNHLLMKIEADTNKSVKFVKGDSLSSSKWTLLKGAAQFDKESIIVTSEPSSKGRINLNLVELVSDIDVSFNFKGNVYGTQSIYLRADSELRNYIKLELKNNVFSIYDCIEEKEILLYAQMMDEFDGITYESIEENEDASLRAVAKLKDDLVVKYDENIKKTIDGAEPYVPRIQYKKRDNRQVNIIAEKDSLSVWLDGKKIVENLTVNTIISGGVMLEGDSGAITYSQRNLTDDVYDAIFEGLVITDISKDKVLIDQRIKGAKKITFEMNVILKNTINWFIDNL